MEFIVKHNVSLKQNGNIVLPRKIRAGLREELVVGQPVKIYFNDEEIGEKRLNSDYRISVGKSLAEAVEDSSKVTVKIEGSNIFVYVA